VKKIFFLVALVIAGLASCKKPKVVAPVIPEIDSLKIGLIAYYPFNNSAADLSGNGNDGTVSNITSVPDRNGKPNAAYHFDGVSSYIAVADNPALRLGNANFTLSAWVNLDGYNPSYASTIISKRLAGINNGWLWAINGYLNPPPLGGVYYGPGGGNADAIGNRVLVPGQWYMVTFVYTPTNSQANIYVNGVLDQIINGILPANGTINAGLFIGKDSASTNGYYFQGSLDDVRIYNKALGASMVLKLYNTVY
jgi:Concanavalin A-like lectin/glucanases superfamily